MTRARTGYRILCTIAIAISAIALATAIIRA